jgi:hypothetical protein
VPWLLAFFLAAPSDPLTTLEHGKNFNLRLRAVMRIIRTHDPKYLQRLGTTAHDTQMMTRALTAIALSGYSRAQAEPLLTPLTKDSADLVRRSAAAALSDIAEAEKVPKLPPASQPAAPRVLQQKSGPRLALDEFTTRGAPELALVPAARVLSEALDDEPQALWSGEVGTSEHKAAYALIGNATWSEHKNSSGTMVKLQIRGTLQSLPAHQLLGEVSAGGTATLPAGLDPTARATTLQKTLRRTAEAVMGDVIDLVNVDRQTNGQSILR